MCPESISNPLRGCNSENAHRYDSDAKNLPTNPLEDEDENDVAHEHLQPAARVQFGGGTFDSGCSGALGLLRKEHQRGGLSK
jgi:hypothetical protein